MKLLIKDDSKNYTGVVIRLRNTLPLEGLDKLVGVNVFGNLALIGKDYPLGELYVFFPSGVILSDKLLSKNNLFRHSNLNEDNSKAGFFDDNCRVKAIKFRGHKSTGFIIQLEALAKLGIDVQRLVEGDEFNEIDDKFICKKYVVPIKHTAGAKAQSKILDNLVDKLLFKEHFDTEHLLKYLNKLNLNEFVITIKLHGTSARTAYTLTRRRLTWKEKIAKLFGCKVQEDEYNYVVGSRHTIKSVAFGELKNKQHFYSKDEKGQDLWTRVAEENFAGKLHKGECVYYEIIGKTFEGSEIQKNYSYGFTKPEIFIYRISQVNPQGVEVDLSWSNMKMRCNELGIQYVPEVFHGSLNEYMVQNGFENSRRVEDFAANLQSRFLEKPSIYDRNVIEEGIVLRLERYPRPQCYKLKAQSFVLHESSMADQSIPDIEENQECVS